jgi:hypothetical protein
MPCARLHTVFVMLTSSLVLQATDMYLFSTSPKQSKQKLARLTFENQGVADGWWIAAIVSLGPENTAPVRRDLGKAATGQPMTYNVYLPPGKYLFVFDYKRGIDCTPSPKRVWASIRNINGVAREVYEIYRPCTNTVFTKLPVEIPVELDQGARYHVLPTGAERNDAERKLVAAAMQDLERPGICVVPAARSRGARTVNARCQPAGISYASEGTPPPERLR